MSAPREGSATPPQHPTQQPLAWLLDRAKLSKDAQKAIARVTEVDAVLKALLDAGHPIEALRVLAHALPPREAIWWAWAAATHAARLAGEEGVAPAVTDALAAAERWIGAPDEESRRAAWAASEGAGLDTPAGSACAAAFFASGSLAPPDIAPVPPPPGMHSMMVANAVTFATLASPEHLQAMAAAYITQGLEVLKQVGGWDRSVELSRAYYEAQREQHRAATAPKAPAPAPAQAPPPAPVS